LTGPLRSRAGFQLIRAFDSVLHNHVSLVTRKETSLHFKNHDERGRELNIPALSNSVRQAVRASAHNTRFLGGYSA
jgi:hypothetical protein